MLLRWYRERNRRVLIPFILLVINFSTLHFQKLGSIRFRKFSKLLSVYCTRIRVWAISCYLTTCYCFRCKVALICSGLVSDRFTGWLRCCRLRCCRGWLIVISTSLTYKTYLDSHATYRLRNNPVDTSKSRSLAYWNIQLKYFWRENFHR